MARANEGSELVGAGDRIERDKVTHRKKVDGLDSCLNEYIQVSGQST